MHKVLTRRGAVMTMAATGLYVTQALAKGEQAPEKQLTPAQRYLLASLPVNDWLELRQTTLSDVRGRVQSIVASTRGASFNGGPSEITNGEAMTVSAITSLLGDPWLRVFSLVFDPKGVLELVIFMFQRKDGDRNVPEIINRLIRKLEPYAPPILIAGTDDEATDKYYLYDIGNFVVEMSIPQYSSLIPVYFTTKATHKIMRTADRTYNKFQPYLEKPAG